MKKTVLLTLTAAFALSVCLIGCGDKAKGVESQEEFAKDMEEQVNAPASGAAAAGAAEELEASGEY